jgi:hypothetical protein
MSSNVRDLAAREAQQKASREMLLRPRRFRDEVFIEGIQATVTLQSLSLASRQIIQDRAQVDGKYDEQLAGLLTIALSVVDPELTLEDVEVLKEQDVGIIDELHLHIAMMNNMGKVEGLKKESSKIETSDSDSSKQNGSG